MTDPCLPKLTHPDPRSTEFDSRFILTVVLELCLIAVMREN